ncbi:MAG: DUF2318 domain-containing protein [Chloroflexi bacterium]|nr:DUF2318 domain-containing protein [Chloroflexota bacterium]
MVESLVITLREGIEAALVVGIILAYLTKTGRNALNRYVYAGIILATVASLAVAGMFRLLEIDPENEIMEGTMLGVAGLFVASMVIWMWRTARNIKRQMEERLSSIVGDKTSSGDLAKQGVGLLAFTFFMVFREGVETVLFLAAATLGDLDVLSFIGGALGLGLAFLFAVFFIRGSLRINLSRFFSVTSIVLLLLAAKLLAGSAHEFAEVGLIPMSKEVMAFLGYFVRDESSMIIVMALLALPMVLIMWETKKSSATAEPNAAQLTAAERRKKLAAVQRERTWRFALVGATLLILLAMGSTVLAGPKFYDPEPVAIAAVGGAVRIPAASLEEGKLHKFVVQGSATSARFLAVKLKDGTIATAHDACQICGTAGYMQEGEFAICKNCNAPISMPTLGMGGGCNPIALKSKMNGTDIEVAVRDIEEAKLVFGK